MRSNHIITVKGEKLTIAEAARKYNINYHALELRITRYGMTPDEAVSNEVVPGGYFIKDKLMTEDRKAKAKRLWRDGWTQKKIAEMLNVHPSVISRVVNNKRNYERTQTF